MRQWKLTDNVDVQLNKRISQNLEQKSRTSEQILLPDYCPICISFTYSTTSSFFLFVKSSPVWPFRCEQMLCIFSLYSSDVVLPKARDITLFFPKKNLQLEFGNYLLEQIVIIIIGSF